MTDTSTAGGGEAAATAAASAPSAKINPFLQRGIAMLGGPAAASRHFGCSLGAVRFYLQGERPFPPEYAPIIEWLTQRQILCEQLCPEVPWWVLRTPANVPLVVPLPAAAPPAAQAAGEAAA